MKKVVKITGAVVVAGLILVALVVGYSVIRHGAPAPTPTSPSETVAPLKKQRVFMVALGNDGEMGEKIGCEDSLVGIERWVLSEGDVLANIYVDLLSLHEARYDDSGLHNALWQSSLTLKSAIVENGIAKISLEGELKHSGTCDAPRIKAQLEKPALEQPGVSAVEVTVNGKMLAQVLSQQ